MGGFSLLSREQEKKKLFLELGNRFNLPKELIIYLYQVLMNSIKHDRDLQINFHKNILSSHFCGPSSTQDIDEPLTLNNPFQHNSNPSHKVITAWLIQRYLWILSVL